MQRKKIEDITDDNEPLQINEEIKEMAHNRNACDEKNTSTRLFIVTNTKHRERDISDNKIMIEKYNPITELLQSKY